MLFGMWVVGVMCEKCRIHEEVWADEVMPGGIVNPVRSESSKLQGILTCMGPHHCESLFPRLVEDRWVSSLSAVSKRFVSRMEAPATYSSLCHRELPEPTEAAGVL